MAIPIQIRRGLGVNVAGASASDGEPLWATDTHELWVSQSGTKYRVGGSALPDPVTADHGGTGQTSLAAHGVLVGAGTGAVSVTGPGTAGQVLVSGGAGADPAFTTVLDLGSVGGGNTLTTYSGTTANAYATVFSVSRGDGVLGTLTVKNTGAGAVTFKRTVTDAFGVTAADTPGMTGGQTAIWDLDSLTVSDTFGGSGLTAMPPLTAFALEAKSAIPGSPATYGVALALTATGGAVSLSRYLAQALAMASFRG
jgi:hypothetical protein